MKTSVYDYRQYKVFVDTVATGSFYNIRELARLWDCEPTNDEMDITRSYIHAAVVKMARYCQMNLRKVDTETQSE